MDINTPLALTFSKAPKERHRLDWQVLRRFFFFAQGEMEDEKKATTMEEKEEAAASDVSLKELSKKLDDFAKERDWEMYHAPRNLLLAMITEVGELSELFMWKGEVAKGLPGWKESEKEHLGEELSDVLLYLIRLSDMCGVDLGDAATRKIVKNAVKYPAPSKST